MLQLVSIGRVNGDGGELSNDFRRLNSLSPERLASVFSSGRQGQRGSRVFACDEGASHDGFCGLATTYCGQ